VDVTDWIFRCDIDAEYFPTPGKSQVDALNEEDAELFKALSDLAAEGVVGPLVPGRR
jgi:hypothetical protein